MRPLAYQTRILPLNYPWMVQGLGVEPSSLGLQPSALTTRATLAWGKEGESNSPLKASQAPVLDHYTIPTMARKQGIEPYLVVLETIVRPLHHFPLAEGKGFEPLSLSTGSFQDCWYKPLTQPSVGYTFYTNPKVSRNA
jgi:hypothetical protein